MDKLITYLGLKQDYDFEDYAMKIFMKGKRMHGSYWEHLNVRKLSNLINKKTHVPYSFFIFKNGWKHRNHENFKLVWYEDMIEDLPKVIREIADFIGYKVI